MASRMYSTMMKNPFADDDEEEEEQRPKYIHDIPMTFEEETGKKEKESKDKEIEKVDTTKQVLQLEHVQTVEDLNYEFPPIVLLEQGEGKKTTGSKKALADNALKLEKTLRSFGVSAKVENVSVGPAITRYELKPAEGVRVSKIANITPARSCVRAYKNTAMTIDIYSKGEYPANVLSNFSANRFIFEGVECASMEGFLQALKFKSAKKQIEICRMSGKEAKAKGSKKFMWKLTGNLYWQGKRYKRQSEQFDKLRLRAYEALLSNGEFYNALYATKGYELTHSIGKHGKRKTILTEEEFIGYLNYLRDRQTP